MMASVESVAATAKAAPAARLVNVRKRFGYHDVVRGVSLEVPTGSRLVVTGPNGAGKSTLLRILATQWQATVGQVEVLGRDLKRHVLWVRSRIGVVLHEPFLRREMTLEENLRFTGALHGLSRERARERAGELMERFGLSHRRRDAVGTFSQGLLKRSSLARSLLGDPALWLLDEPFSGLDPAGRELLSSVIREHTAGGGDRTVVLVTHELELGRSLATHSARLEGGRLVAFAQGAGAMDGLDGHAGGEEAGG